MSIIKHSEQRVGVFIDAQNLYHSARHLYNKRVNFEAVLNEAVAGRKLIRALAYVISSEAGDESTFFEALTKQGIETKTKDLQIFSDGSKKADWDVGIAVDAITLAHKLDAVILISGDGDFVPLVKYLQHHSGIQVEVVSFGSSSSASLIEATDDFLDLSDDPKKYLIGSRRARSSSSRSRSSRSPRSSRTTPQEKQVNTIVTENKTKKESQPKKETKENAEKKKPTRRRRTTRKKT